MTPEPTSPLSRRAFGRVLGAAALAGALPEMAGAMPSSEPTSAATSPAQPEPSAPDVIGDEICDLTAVDLAARIGRKQLSAREVM